MFYLIYASKSVDHQCNLKLNCNLEMSRSDILPWMIAPYPQESVLPSVWLTCLLCCVGAERLFCLAVGSPSVGFCGTCVTGGFWDMLSLTGCSTLACKKDGNMISIDHIKIHKRDTITKYCTWKMYVYLSNLNVIWLNYIITFKHLQFIHIPFWY